MDWYPLYNSVGVAAVSTAIVYFLGIFLANVVARAPCVAKGVLDVVLTLPLVLPPTVVGYLLLLGPGHPRGHARRVDGHHPARLPFASGGWHRRPNADCQPPGQPEGGA